MDILAIALAATVTTLGNWTFLRGDPATEGEEVSVPHDWAIAGPFDREIDKQTVAIVQDGERKATEKTGRTGALPWIGEGVYRCRITIPEDTGFASLVFDGAMSEPQVFFDGRKVGEWKHGYNAFEVVLPCEPGEHDLAVKLNNVPLSSRWYPGAGLFRPVRLVLGDEVGIPVWGQSLVTPDLETLEVKTELRNPRNRKTSVQYRVLDASGRCVASGVSPLKVSGALPWTPETPVLYTLETDVECDGRTVDVHRERFGFRTVAVGKDGFRLNDKLRKFKGVCLHHDLGPLGAAFDADAFRRQVTLLKEMGCDSIRTSHNMPGREQLDVCDELGMLVMAESFDCWKDPKVANGYNRFFDDWWRRDLTNLILACRNHPSVVMWSIGNEIPEQLRTFGGRLAAEMQDLCHRLDPTRPVTQGFNCVLDAIRKSGMLQVMDVAGLNYRLHNYTNAHAVAKGGLVLGCETASTVSSRGEYFFPVKPGAGVEHPNGQCSGYDVECCPWSNLPDDDWAMQDDNVWTMGEFVWTGFDYLGEPTPYNTYWPSRSAYFGIFDLAGLPKDRYWLYRSRWNEREHTCHLVPHWTFPGREGQVTPVYCYTDCVSAELFINGRSQGRRTKDRTSRLDRYRLRWNETVYEPGELKVIAYGADGQVVATDVVRTAGAPARLALEKRRFGKLLFVTVTVVDKDGICVPDADCTIAVKAGEGLRFRGSCNGDATSLESFVKPRMKAFHGKLVAIFEGEGDAVVATIE